MYQWQLQYGMNNYKKSIAEKGDELFLANYQVGEGKMSSQLKLAI